MNARTDDVDHRDQLYELQRVQALDDPCARGAQRDVEC